MLLVHLCYLHSAVMTESLRIIGKPPRLSEPANSIRDNMSVQDVKRASLFRSRPLLPRIESVITPTKRFQHVVQFGNNSMLVRALLRNRPWVQPYCDFCRITGKGLRRGGSPSSSVNFLWTQYKCQTYLDAKLSGVAFEIVKNVETGIVPKASTRVCKELMRIHNHFEGVASMCTKRGLLESLTAYLGDGVRAVMPESFVFKVGQDADAFENNLRKQGETIWIVKPGEFSNRGSGIQILKTVADVMQLVRQPTTPSWVVQKYIQRPMLLEGRKFDIRSYGFISSKDGSSFEGYFFPHAYVRTASEQYSINNIDDRMAHLNNDAVQKHGKNYGKAEPGNKLTLEALEKKLKGTFSMEKVMSDIKDITTCVFKACKSSLNPRNQKHCFEVVGFDFMVDDDCKVWLIEANTNPCLELVNAWLAHVIPTMLEGALRLTLDDWTVGPQQYADANRWVPLDIN